MFDIIFNLSICFSMFSFIFKCYFIFIEAIGIIGLFYFILIYAISTITSNDIHCMLLPTLPVKEKYIYTMVCNRIACIAIKI